MNKKFEKYLKELADHEEQKVSYLVKDPRNRILVNAGLHLNWLGDFFANPKIKWIEKEIPIDKIMFTGTSPENNKILIDKCERSPKKFRDYLLENPKARKEFEKWVSFGNEPILVRHDEKKEGYYKVLDGMHRFTGAVLEGKKKIKTILPINEFQHLPYCEPHTVYDLIRAYQRHARDKEGQKSLYHALKLLSRTYENVIPLLKTRLGKKWIPDKDVQDVIRKVLK